MQKRKQKTKDRGIDVLPPLPPVDVNQRYNLEEAARYLRKSRSSLFAEIRAGTLPTILDGKRRYVPGAVIVARSTLPSAAA